jgi:hypothetical protein
MKVRSWLRGVISGDEICSNPMAAYQPTAELQLLILRIAGFGQEPTLMVAYQVTCSPLPGGASHQVQALLYTESQKVLSYSNLASDKAMN